MKTIVTLTASSVLLWSATALADTPCKLSKDVTLELTSANIQQLQISLGPDQLDLEGYAGKSGELRVRYCASDQKRLDALEAKTSQRGDLVTLELDHGGRSNVFRTGLFRSSDYGYFQIKGQVPESWSIDVTVGSGKAEIENVAAVTAVVGSGELEVDNIAGAVSAQVGSGKIDIERAGSVNISAIGSGRLEVDNVRGSVSIQSIGSGRASVEDVTGDITVRSIGSGRLTAKDVDGDVMVNTSGSGAITVTNIKGDFTLRSKGSGKVSHTNVSGTVSVPNR
ncbi:MAG: DUF4097 family beta strand repeat-containing protein [Firmicutes bacterium]|nr:DUF4097 family beta strand repeat-containing protein [Bacillota bacterium]